MKHSATITYDDKNDATKGLLDKVLGGGLIKQFGNFFRGESPPIKESKGSLKTERQSNNSKPPLYKQESNERKTIEFESTDTNLFKSKQYDSRSQEICH